MALMTLPLHYREDRLRDSRPIYLLHLRWCNELPWHMLWKWDNVRLLQGQAWGKNQALLAIKAGHLHLQAHPVHYWLRWGSRGSLWQLWRWSEWLQKGELETLEENNRLSERLVLCGLQEFSCDVQVPQVGQQFLRQLKLGTGVDVGE